MSPARSQLQVLMESWISTRSRHQLWRSLVALCQSRSQPRRSLNPSYGMRTRRALLYLKRVPAPYCKSESHFPEKAQKVVETFDEESTAPKDTASKDGDEVVIISNENGTRQDALDPSSSQSTEVPSQK